MKSLNQVILESSINDENINEGKGGSLSQNEIDRLKDIFGDKFVAGTILVHKIAGALAETGASLAEVKAVAEKVIENVRTMGMAITACTVPAAGKPGFELTCGRLTPSGQ